MNKSIELTEEQISGIISFILNHEREEIPDDVWEGMQSMREQTDWW